MAFNLENNGLTEKEAASQKRSQQMKQDYARCNNTPQPEINPFFMKENELEMRNSGVYNHDEPKNNLLKGGLN